MSIFVTSLDPVYSHVSLFQKQASIADFGSDQSYSGTKQVALCQFQTETNKLPSLLLTNFYFPKQ